MHVYQQFLDISIYNTYYPNSACTEGSWRPGGFSRAPVGAAGGQRLVYGRAFLMQMIGIRDIYPSKTYGKQGVAKNHPHKTQ